MRQADTGVSTQGWALAGFLLLIPAIGFAQGEEPQSQGSSIGVSFTGSLRLDMAIRTTDRENIVNQRGNPFNGRPVARSGPVAPMLPPPDVVARNGQPADNDFNLQQLRGEFDMDVNFTSNWRAFARLRAIYELGEYDEFDPDAVGSQAVGFNSQEPEYFEYDDFDDGGSQNPLEEAGENYLIDLPALYLDYQRGALLVRTGNQQIAWGQALFFRVLDVPNGLDLRRHLFLDYAPEEYADERISALGIRATYQLTQAWELDSFVQKFQPTIYPNPNTPYNAIASQFSIHDDYDDVENKLNYGARIKGQLGKWGLQFIATQRYNPDGVFRWTESNVDRDIPGLTGSGALVAQTPFEVDTTGVWSADEWFTYAGNARLDGIQGPNTIIREFPAAGMLGATEQPDFESASDQLDLFFQLAGGAALGQSSGGFRGHIVREYFQEEIYGAGASYVFAGAPGSITDQLIVNFEATFTPDKKFTEKSLSRFYTEDDEWVMALVMEKYQRISERFPATYFVFQAIHKTQSDLFGRHLDGMGGDIDQGPQGISGGFNAMVFAFQQPFPNLIWRADFAALYDLRGGILVQPAIRWSPSTSIIAEAYYNYFDGDLGGDPNENIMQTLDYADELGIRLRYQF